jgi:uncharacterized membrane protein
MSRVGQTLVSECSARICPIYSFETSEFDCSLLPLEIENPVNESERKRFEVIERRLSTLETAIPLISENDKKSKWRKLNSWVVKNPIAPFVIALLAVLVTVFAIPASGLFGHYLQSRDNADNQKIDSRIDSKLNPINAQLTDIDGKITKLQATLNTLQPFIQDLVQKEMTTASAMSKPEFEAALPKIAHALTTARNQNLTVQTSAVNRVSERLLAIDPHTTPDFWPAAAALISYRDERPAHPTLPDCAKQTPGLTMSTPLRAPFPHGKYGEGLEYKNCTIVLDDANEVVNSNLWIVEHRSMKQDPRSNQQFTLTLDNVHVIYRGGTIIPADIIIFNSCTFELNIQKIPPPRAQSLTHLLLASRNVQTLTLGSPSHQENSGM